MIQPHDYIYIYIYIYIKPDICSKNYYFNIAAKSYTCVLYSLWHLMIQNYEPIAGDISCYHSSDSKSGG